jgi:hypothetical protein
MTFSFRRSLTVLVVFTLLLPLTPADGRQLSIKTESTVGLDEATRALIDHYPKNIHDQILDLIAQALPLIKGDVDHYITEVNDSVQKQLMNTQCAATGLAAEFKDQFKAIFTNPKGPLAQFAEDEARAIRRRGKDSSPRNYADIYGDLFHESAVMYCQMQISGASENAIGYENQYRRLNSIWLPLVGRCDNASACVQTVFKDTQNVIQAGDKRDVQLVNATEKLSKIAQPHVSWLTWGFDPTPYEDTLEKLFKIQREVSVAKVRREYMAADLVAEAKNKLSNMSDEIGKGETDLKPVNQFPCLSVLTPAKVADAQTHAAGAEAMYREINDSLSLAATLDAANQTKAAENIKAELNPKGEEIKTIKAASPFSRQIPGCGVHMN